MHTVHFLLKRFFETDECIMIIVAGNGHDDSSSNPGRKSLYFYISLMPFGRLGFNPRSSHTKDFKNGT